MTPTINVCCNGASTAGFARPLILEYRPTYSRRNVRLGLPSFIVDLFHIPARTLDLLELAAYVYAADRHSRRGRRDAVEFHSWSRRFRIRIRVRDQAFWNRSDVQTALQACLVFLTGDAMYSFEFIGGHKTPPTSLFDQEGLSPTLPGRQGSIALFSGGLDSLAGVVRTLTNTSECLTLVSHQSQPGIIRTQRALISALQERFPSRVQHYAFECSLTNVRAAEETQRSRSFLYTAIGYALAQANGADSLSVFENGVTSLNLRRREDLSNARASRTTHPRALAGIQKLLSLLSGKAFAIRSPSFWFTKRDVIEDLMNSRHADLIASSVSCSRTFQREGDATQCGRCFQCVDRRMAVFAASAEAHDDVGLYTRDIIRKAITEQEARTTLVDYVRQAATFADGTEDGFYHDYITELASAMDYLPTRGTELERVARVWTLMHTHGTNVRIALNRMRELYDDPLKPLPRHSLLDLVATRQHLRPALQHLTEAISGVVDRAIGRLFRGQRPANENDLNSKFAALIGSHVELTSEHPSVSFACALAVPDHSVTGTDLVIEAKYIRAHTSPSKAVEGMAADLTKYTVSVHILFLVYDPDHRIADDARFRNDFEVRGRCTVAILR